MTTDETIALMIHSQRALGWSQRELAEHMGTSLRTVARWQAGQSHFGPDEVTKLARFVHPVNRALASQLLGTLNLTLESAGFEPPSEPAAPTPPPGADPRVAVASRPTALRDLIDAIVCSVADAANVAPKVVRPSVLLTLRRALEIGLDLEVAARAGVLDGEGVGAVHPNELSLETSSVSQA